MAMMPYGWPGRRRRSQDMQTSGTHRWRKTKISASFSRSLARKRPRSAKDLATVR
jgi:hypothetical protein